MRELRYICDRCGRSFLSQPIHAIKVKCETIRRHASGPHVEFEVDWCDPCADAVFRRRIPEMDSLIGHPRPASIITEEIINSPKEARDAK